MGKAIGPDLYIRLVQHIADGRLAHPELLGNPSHGELLVLVEFQAALGEYGALDRRARGKASWTLCDAAGTQLLGQVLGAHAEYPRRIFLFERRSST